MIHWRHAPFLDCARIRCVPLVPRNHVVGGTHWSVLCLHVCSTVDMFPLQCLRRSVHSFVSWPGFSLHWSTPQDIRPPKLLTDALMGRLAIRMPDCDVSVSSRRLYPSPQPVIGLGSTRMFDYRSVSLCRITLTPGFGMGCLLVSS